MGTGSREQAHNPQEEENHTQDKCHRRAELVELRKPGTGRCRYWPYFVSSLRRLVGIRFLLHVREVELSPHGPSRPQINAARAK